MSARLRREVVVTVRLDPPVIGQWSYGSKQTALTVVSATIDADTGEVGRLRASAVAVKSDGTPSKADRTASVAWEGSPHFAGVPQDVKRRIREEYATCVAAAEPMAAEVSA